jgi:biopolymer transport protein ExbD
MAQIESGNDQKKGQKSRKVSTKIDMTPMVDLAFLLITFFMLTTTFHKPKAMEVRMPEDDGETHVRQSSAITIVLGEKDQVYWYQGDINAPVKPVLQLSDYSGDGIRKVIRQKNEEIGINFVVVIKPLDKSKYKNMVDILDEMTITNTRRFAIVKTSHDDLEMIGRL